MKKMNVLRRTPCSLFIRKMFKSKQQTVENHKSQVTKILVDGGIDGVEAESSSSLLIAHIVLGRKTLSGISQMTHIRPSLSRRLCGLVKRRINREPVQYILGTWDVGDLTLEMRRPVFIPRPETEQLISLVSEDITTYTRNDDTTCTQNDDTTKGVKVLEIGCGTGAICLNLLHRHSNISAVAIDTSPDACTLTRDNCAKYNLNHRLSVVHCTVDSSTEWIERVTENGTKFDVLVSNPPYIDPDDMASLQPEILQYEDHGALDGGECGLSVIKHILHSARHLLNNNGSVWLEVGLGQCDLIKEYVCTHEHLNLEYIQSFSDLTDRSLDVAIPAKTPLMEKRQCCRLLGLLLDSLAKILPSTFEANKRHTKTSSITSGG